METKLLGKRLGAVMRGEVTDAREERARVSRDTSLFEEKPRLVVYPKDARDLCALVKEVRALKGEGEAVSITARAAGTDMTGGPLSSSIVADVMRHMNRVLEVGDGYAVTEPGVYYRDFEKETLAKGFILPSYPASRRIAALGGMIGNNAGGERTLRYGKTDRYVKELDVVLSDGSLSTLRPITKSELEEKEREQTFEGEIYRKMNALIRENRDLIKNAKPKVSKNSAGYALWSVWDETRGTFDLTKLIVGSQGTLALVSKARLALVRPKKERAMLIIFLKDFSILPEITRRVLALEPESFESYDNHTFTLALKFLPQVLSHLGFSKAFRLGVSFLPELSMLVYGGVPKLVLMAEFAEDTDAQALEKARAAEKALEELTLQTRIAPNEEAAEKYWIVRRESFSLLRKNLRGYYASPFIDDLVVPVDAYPTFLPELTKLLKEYPLIETIAGHIGNGNFHIIPLMDLKNPDTRRILRELTPRVYALVLRYGGSITGEHNDGIIRTPYLETMFGKEVCELFRKTKEIFDPAGIFNPGKKVGGTLEDIERLMRRA